MSHPCTIRHAVLIAVGLWLSAAAPAPRPGALLPLTEADGYRIKEAGCTFAFAAGRRTMFTSVENVVLVRTKAGPSQCRIPDKAIEAFRDAKGPITCGGQRLSLKRAGKQVDPEEGSEGDGSVYPAVLTIGAGPGATTLRGEASTAC